MNPRAEELLIERAIRGLDDKEHRELDDLGAGDDDSYDLAAAAAAIATTPIEAMPASVSGNILRAAGATTDFTRTIPGTGTVDDFRKTIPGAARVDDFKRTLPGVLPQGSTERAAVAVPTSPQMQTLDAPIPIDRGRKQRSRSATIAWAAAAACIVVAGGALWWALRQQRQEISTVAVVEKTPAERRAELLSTSLDVTTISWTTTPDAAAKTAGGDVVWSQSKQQGFMRFTGLLPNDPTQWQYQLWIFDKNRDQAFPVDGGVFDVSSIGEVIVPITAKLRVDDATLFAVTIEKPGGVVVSKRERIVVTATRG